MNHPFWYNLDGAEQISVMLQVIQHFTPNVRNWLREIVHQHADCYFKWFELAVFGGANSNNLQNESFGFPLWILVKKQSSTIKRFP